MVSSAAAALPRLIQWREDAAPKRRRVLAAPPSSRARPAARLEPELALQRAGTDEWILPDQPVDIRGRMIDILV